MFIELSIYSPTSSHYGHGQNPIFPWRRKTRRGDEETWRGEKFQWISEGLHWSCKTCPVTSDIIKTFARKWDMVRAMQETEDEEESRKERGPLSVGRKTSAQQRSG